MLSILVAVAAAVRHTLNETFIRKESQLEIHTINFSFHSSIQTHSTAHTYETSSIYRATSKTQTEPDSTISI